MYRNQCFFLVCNRQLTTYAFSKASILLQSVDVLNDIFNASGPRGYIGRCSRIEIHEFGFFLSTCKDVDRRG
jgi:hypothetical protein